MPFKAPVPPPRAQPWGRVGTGLSCLNARALSSCCHLARRMDRARPSTQRPAVLITPDRPALHPSPADTPCRRCPSACLLPAAAAGAARLPVCSFGSCRVSAARVPQRPVHRRHWPQEAPSAPTWALQAAAPQCLSQPVPQAAASGPVRALPLGFHTTCPQLGGGSCGPWRPTPAGATLYVHCPHCPCGSLHCGSRG